MQQKRFTLFVLGAMVAGIAVGAVGHNLPAADGASLAGTLSILTDIFLRLIKMIIAPLVFSTLVVGIAHMEDVAAIGRVGVKTLGWFLLAGIVSLILGLVMVQILEPGVGMALPDPTSGGKAPDAAVFTLKNFIEHTVPRSVIEAMANNEILQIVVFSIFAGIAIASVKEKVPVVVHLVEQIATVMLKVTSYVMMFAPIAIFAALAATVTTQGLQVLGSYVKFVGGFYLAMALLWVVLLAAAVPFIGGRVRELVSAIRQPVLLAFSTASSEAAYPRTLERMQAFGAARKIVSFVLPLGYSFNLDGSMIYCTFATMFIAQAYGIHISIGQQVEMLGLLLLTSKGIAGVPRASLVVIAAALPFFHIPSEGMVLVLAVDHLLDMGRSATNVVGVSVAAAVIAKWEGLLGPGHLADGEEDI
ncbi:dicarboxylate/amino acid:cation symporter [Nitrospirillum sp. BR 11164]|uniref:dicarboxylate/amino acid:cation symporter n=1 Tax=Nitrospirillum sp. BR 11164 TaxID=3104324 RepID=UPI002AFF73CD|nr:dicarboxylate/amino acid:cation symporter [Nitrospirillum sp. BR 11164]MEA1649543.1 dicarboxylate/amino acid:cation symporter [Nitrospirillum sp. BR 11164]